MLCSDCQAKLSAFRDGELDTAEREAVAAHLAECPCCDACLCDFSRIGELLRSDPVCCVPGELWRRIAVAAQAAPTRHQRIHCWFSRAAAVAAGFALYVIGYGALSGATRSHGAIAMAGTAGVERMLHETALALAGDWPRDTGSMLFEQTPETQLLRQLNKDTGP